MDKKPVALTIIDHIPDTMKIEIRSLLADVDSMFLPPLSTRFPSGLDGYVQELIGLEGVFLYDDRELVGIAIIKSHHDEDDADLHDVTYLQVIAIRGDHRGQGHAHALYSTVKSMHPEGIWLRTWSTNATQIHILGKRGWTVGKVLKDHRGPGIDTIYFHHGSDQPAISA